MFRQRRFYLSPDSDPGNPGAGSGASGQQQAGQQQGQQPDPQAAFQSLLDRNANDAQRVAWLLYQENHDHRGEARQLREQVQQLQNQVQQLQGQIPQDGSTVLNGEQAAAWTRYQEFGAPDDIAALQNNLNSLQRGQLLRDAAQAHGYRVSVLQTLASDSLTLELRPNADGSGQTAHVITGDNQATPLPEYAQANWSDFMPALQERPQTQTFPRQTPGTPPPAADPVQAELNRRYAPPKKESN